MLKTAAHLKIQKISIPVVIRGRMIIVRVVGSDLRNTASWCRRTRSVVLEATCKDDGLENSLLLVFRKAELWTLKRRMGTGTEHAGDTRRSRM